MLVSAIKSHLSSSKTKAVVLDLLSAKDLEALRNNVPLQQASPPPTAEKLYLILTYAVAFDRFVRLFAILCLFCGDGHKLTRTQSSLSTAIDTDAPIQSSYFKSSDCPNPV